MNANALYRQFSGGGDYGKPFHHDIRDMLEAGYPVLIFAGDKDYICNWLGQVAWTEALQWSGAANYKAANMHPWTVNGQGAGEAKSANGLTFLRVFDAGHMGMYNTGLIFSERYFINRFEVPHDQPANALNMLNRWIKGDYLFN